MKVDENLMKVALNIVRSNLWKWEKPVKQSKYFKSLKVKGYLSNTNQYSLTFFIFSNKYPPP